MDAFLHGPVNSLHSLPTDILPLRFIGDMYRKAFVESVQDTVGMDRKPFRKHSYVRFSPAVFATRRKLKTLSPLSGG